MTAGITGHQNLGSPETMAWVMEQIKQALVKYRIAHGFTSLAVGADQLFAQILREQNIPYTAVIPCREYEATFQTRADLKNYRGLLQTATGFQTLDFGPPTETAFMEAGKRVIDLADMLFAVWNGQPAKGLGGTGDAVKYALFRKKCVLHINPMTQQVTEM